MFTVENHAMPAEQETGVVLPVSVHWNLHTLMWSVQVETFNGPTGKKAKKSSDYLEFFTTNTHFRVGEAGRLRNIGGEPRNLHAWSIGLPATGDRLLAAKLQHSYREYRISYNPYRNCHFTQIPLDAPTGTLATPVPESYNTTHGWASTGLRGYNMNCAISNIGLMAQYTYMIGKEGEKIPRLIIT